MTDDVHIRELTRQIWGLDQLPQATLDENCDTGLNTVKHHPQWHGVEDLETFVYLNDLYAYPFKTSNLRIKRAYSTTSKQRSSVIVETVSVMDTSKEKGLISTDGMRNVQIFSEAGPQYIYTVQRITWLEIGREIQRLFRTKI